MGGWRQRLLHSIRRGVPRHALAICVDALHARCWPNHGACASPCLQLGIPVRVTRKQTDKHGHYGCAYVYDGLVSQALGGCSSAADQPDSQPAWPAWLHSACSAPLLRCCCLCRCRHAFHMPHASQHVLRPPACTALLQYDVVAYRRKKGITDKYVYQFQMIRREGQGPLLSEVSPSLD